MGAKMGKYEATIKVELEACDELEASEKAGELIKDIPYGIRLKCGETKKIEEYL